MADELTIEECNFAVGQKRYYIDYNEYMVRLLNTRVDDLNNKNKTYEIDIKLLKFMQNNGFKLDVDFNEYKKSIQINIDDNNKIIAKSNLEKTLFQTDIESIKIEISELEQTVGFLLGKKALSRKKE